MARIEDIELERYGDSRPTPFDTPGLMARSMGHGQKATGEDDDTDRSQWLIVPVSRTRDSGPLDESNFASAEKLLEAADPSGDDHENHRFGHWGPGWFEMLIVRPDTKAHRAAQEIAASLENYPVLDDDDLSEREMDEENESWEAWARRDIVLEMAKMADLDSDAFEDVSDDDLRALVYVEHGSDGTSFEVDVRGYNGERVTRARILSLPGLNGVTDIEASDA